MEKPLKNKSIPKDVLLSDMIKHINDGWSFDVCLSKSGIRNNNLKRILLKSMPELRELRRRYNERRKAIIRCGNASVYDRYKNVGKYDS